MKYPLLIAACFLLAAFLYGNVDITQEAYADWDLHQYIKIAQAAPELDPTVERPFAFRFLAHYVIGLFPINVHYSYLLLNYAAILILLIVLYRFLVSREVPELYAFFAVIFYIFNKHFIGYNMWNPYQINDILMNLIIIWFLYSIAHRKHLGVACALFLGSIVRETFLILIPTGLVFLLTNDRRARQIVSFCLIALVAASIPYILRQLVPATNGDTLKGAFSVYAIYKLHTIKGVYHYFFNPWIPFTLIPLLLIMIVMRQLGRKTQLMFFAAAVFLTSFHYIIGRYPIPSRNVTIVLSGGSAIVVTLYAFWNKLQENRLRVESYTSD
jgi:hypothetical protein